jgi:muconolactone delta-isomerase
MRFLIRDSLKEPLTEELQALMPATQARGQELVEQGIQEALYVADDQSTVWVVWNCESQAAVEEIHQTFPLHKYLNTEVTLLSDQL